MIDVIAACRRCRWCRPRSALPGCLPQFSRRLLALLVQPELTA